MLKTHAFQLRCDIKSKHFISEMTHISEGNILNIGSDEIMSVNTNENDENVFSSTSNYGTSGESIRPDNNENIGQRKHGVHPKKPLKRSPSTPYLEDKLRRKLKFYFMGPHEKIIARRKCPWKLLLQITKVVLVTVQVSTLYTTICDKVCL
jgi:hypothetical protein